MRTRLTPFPKRPCVTFLKFADLSSVVALLDLDELSEVRLQCSKDVMDIRRLAMKHVVPVACGARLQRHKRVRAEIARALAVLAMLSTPEWAGSALFQGPLPPACPASVVREAVAAADALPDILVRKKMDGVARLLRAGALQRSIMEAMRESMALDNTLFSDEALCAQHILM